MKKKPKNDSHKNLLEEQYLQNAANLASQLGGNMMLSLSQMPLEYKFKIGAIALASLVADFCYAIINKDNPDLSKRLVEDIFTQSNVLLTARYALKANQSETQQ
jgi:hypothetical protein